MSHSTAHHYETQPIDLNSSAICPRLSKQKDDIDMLQRDSIEQRYDGRIRRFRTKEIHKLMQQDNLVRATAPYDKLIYQASFAKPETLASADEDTFTSIFEKSGIRLQDPTGIEKLIYRSKEESVVLSTLKDYYGEQGMPSLNTSLVRISAIYKTEKKIGKPRFHEIGLADGKGMTSIVLISPAELKFFAEQIEAIDASTGPALLKAALAFFCIVHYHPFSDGNGRIARIIFNVIINSMSGKKSFNYLPLYELMYRSQGGYEVSLRKAEIFGFWSDYIHFMTSAFDIAALLK